MSNECYCIAARVLSVVWHALPAEHLHWNITAFKDDTACDTFASADWFLNVKPWERVQMISNVLYTKSSIKNIYCKMIDPPQWLLHGFSSYPPTTCKLILWSSCIVSIWGQAVNYHQVDISKLLNALQTWMFESFLLFRHISGTSTPQVLAPLIHLCYHDLRSGISRSHKILDWWRRYWPHGVEMTRCLLRSLYWLKTSKTNKVHLQVQEIWSSSRHAINHVRGLFWQRSV